VHADDIVHGSVFVLTGQRSDSRADDILSATTDNTFGRAMNSSALQLGNTTAVVGDDVGVSAALPIEFVVVLVLAAACVLVGVIYAYVHISRAARARVEKRKRRPSAFGHHHHHHHTTTSRDMSCDEGSRQTHLMFFRRTTAS